MVPTAHNKSKGYRQRLTDGGVPQVHKQLITALSEARAVHTGTGQGALIRSCSERSRWEIDGAILWYAMEMTWQCNLAARNRPSTHKSLSHLAVARASNNVVCTTEREMRL